MMKLKLGPLPNTDVAKLTITLPKTVKEQLDRYAEIHRANFGSAVDGPTLVPLIVAAFLAKDRAFQRTLKSQPPAKERERGSPIS